ncbi:cytochrome P450 [Flindersiella endophytica]
MSIATMAKPVPVHPGSRLFGSMPALRGDSLGTYTRACRDLGDVVRFDLGPPGLQVKLYGVFSAEGAQQVLAHESANFRKDNPFYAIVRELLGNGLLTSQDDEYMRQRRLVQPLFTRRQVDQYASAMCEEVEEMLGRWAAAPESTVDLALENNRLTLQVVARILFGTDVEDAIRVVRERFTMVNEFTMKRGLAPFQIPLRWPLPANRQALAVQRDLYAICDRIIAQRRAAGASGVERTDLLTLLTKAEDEAGDRLAASEVRDQVLIFLLAGHETTSVSLTFALHLLAKHPSVQERVFAEVSSVLGSRDPVAKDASALTYTTMVLKEAMRLFPAAPATGRRSVADTEIDGYVVPAGSNIFVAPWVTHRHPAYWPDPDRFDPERFTPEAEAARPRYAWFPFGGGPRACIGQYFSMLESVLALALVVRTYKLEAVDVDVPILQGITLRPNGPARCRLTPRV